MNLNFECKDCQISVGYSGKIALDIDGADVDNVLDNIKVIEVVSHFDHGKLLDLIGMKECMNYFDLKENNE
jgi:hypothetical protein